MKQDGRLETEPVRNLRNENYSSKIKTQYRYIEFKGILNLKAGKFAQNAAERENNFLKI